MIENSFNNINAAFNTKCCVMIFKIKVNSATDIFMLKIFANFNFSMNHVFSLLHFWFNDYASTSWIFKIKLMYF